MISPLPDIFAFVIGACVGSFLNVCVSRWPAGLSVVSPPSRCPGCERPIRARENVPILGWVALRGRCAGCAMPISAQYPLVELLVAVVWLFSVMIFGPGLTALRVAVFATIMLGVSITDAKHYVIPDGFTVFGLAWVIVTCFAALFLPSASPFAGPYDAIFGACVGAGAIAITGWIGEVILRKEAMGFGDATLMAVAGAALGPQRAILTIFIGAAIGVVIFVLVVIPASRLAAHRRDSAEGEHELPLVPFGVFLAPGAVVALFFGNEIIQWYITRFVAG